MKITQLDIRDFGIFQGEKLEDLGKGIIVIGGANRAGKTSLMHILRNIPYGFTQDSSLPPPKFQYDVRCDLDLEDGEKANVLLKGYSGADIVYKSGKKNYLSKGLYNIDKATYKELFTISLDELNKSGGKDDSNLQPMLLGAGFKHIVKIPYVARELREKAIAIGGTKGNPSTKMFKPYTENIKKAVDGRKKSLSLLDTFVKKKNTLLQLEEIIRLKETQLQNSTDNVLKLEILKNNFHLNENKKSLERELKSSDFNVEHIKEYNIEKAKSLREQYIKQEKEFNKDNYEFQREGARDALIMDLLLENKSQINSFYNGISGLKEMCKNLMKMQNDYHEKIQALIKRIKKTNDNWTSFKDISEVNCDEMQQGILLKDIERFKDIEFKKAECSKKIEDYKIQKDILEKQIQGYDTAVPMKKYFYLTLIFIILGIGAFFIDKLLGATIIIIGAIGVAIYFIINYSSSKLILKRNAEINIEISNVHIELAKISREINTLEENSRDINNIMDEYRDMLRLDARVEASDIKDYFKMASYLKDEIAQCDLLKKKLITDFNTFIDVLNNIIKAVNKFQSFHESSTDNINGINSINSIESSIEAVHIAKAESVCNDILIKVDMLYKQLLLAQKAQDSSSKLNLLKQEILKFLGITQSEDITFSIEKYIEKGEEYIKHSKQMLELKIIKDKLLQGVKGQRVKNILYDEKKDYGVFEDESLKLLEVLQDLYQQYDNLEELNEEYEDLNIQVEKLRENLESLKNEKQTLKDEIQALNSDEMLLQYDKSINEARSDLRPLAQSYAVYSTAALFLEKMRENFLINTKDKLLKGASDILSEITAGEYKDIMPMEDLMQGDFKTVLQDESIKESTKQLSRGTKEQLFLAVRISRIKEIKPSLPVIFDDSFVNFDIVHTKNTIKALAKLSDTHQIFILTCHGGLVDIIMNQCPQSQFFKLNKGKFEKCLGTDLKQHLMKL